MKMKAAASSIFTSALVSIFAFSLTACGPAPGGPPPTGGTPKVTVVEIQSSPLTLTSELPGRVTSMVDAQIRPQVTGIIKKRLFEEGSMVKAGQLLYKIDPVTYRAAVDSAQATLSRANASLSMSKLKADRNEELVKIRAVSQQESDESDAALQEAKADVASAKAELQTQKINLQYTDIKAPVSGRISRSSATIGSLVTANQSEVLATIQKLDPIYVDVTQSSLALLNLKQSLAADTLKQGSASVDIVLQNGMHYPEKGELQFSEVTVDQDTDMVTLRVKAPNTDHDLLPGMYVQTVLEMGVIDDAILVPQQSVMRDASGNSTVLIVNGDSVVEARPINVSQAVGNKWLVTKGLSTGDRVVVKGLQTARPGAKVELVSADANTAPSTAEK